MSHRILRYETEDGEERFAVYSTVTEGWLWYDMTEGELTEWYLGREARRASEHIAGRIETLRDGENPYQMWDPDAKRRELQKEGMNDD